MSDDDDFAHEVWQGPQWQKVQRFLNLWDEKSGTAVWKHDYLFANGLDV